MGLFPAIDRAWISVDNRLYFWNYRNGSDFHTYEDLDHTILSVNLVKPSPGTFIETVHYLLVLCTPMEICLLAVSYDKARHDFQLYDPGMSVSVKGLDVDQVVGSDKTGRIFFCGSNDGTHLWELQYHNTERWFQGKCSKVCHSRGGLSALCPSFSSLPLTGPIISVLGWAAGTPHPERTISMKIDDSRSLLYTLSSTSTIRVYHLPANRPDAANLVLTYTRAQIISNVRMVDSSYAKYMTTSVQLVSLQIVRATQSSSLHAVAIASNGFRLYLKAGHSFGNTSDTRPPNSIQVVGVRTPPSRKGVMEPLNAKPTSRIFEPGHFFCVVPDEANSGGDQIFVSSLDVGKVIHGLNQKKPQFSYIENGCFLEVEGFVQAVELLTPPFQGSTTPKGFSNDCAAQYSTPPAQVAVLTNTGIYIYTRRLPYQMFEDVGTNTKYFFEWYGRTEVCASVLSVACRTSVASFQVREQATKIFIEMGGRPHLNIDDESTFRAASTTLAGEDTVRLSGRFDGLATYLARIVRGLWGSRVFKVINNGDRKLFSLSNDRKPLEAIQLNLVEISEFLNRNRAFIDGLAGIPDSAIGSASRADEVALQAEHRGLDSLVKLIRSIREGISFLLLLLDETMNATEGIEAVLSYLPNDMRDKMEQLDFRTFFTSPEGTELAKELVTCLINRSIVKGESVDSMARVLQDRCESYCSSNDVIIYKALEYLRKAKAMGDSDAELRMQNLHDSVRMFKKAAASISPDSLKDAVTEFVDLKYYPGAVEVVLSVAAVSDRGNLAWGYISEGKQPDDPRKQAYDKRLSIYSLVFEVLDVVDQTAAKLDYNATERTKVDKLRDTTYTILFESQDEVFHFCFYDWFFTKGLESRLLEVDSPYVLPYLRANAKDNLGIADLLWIYCQKRGDTYAAAEVLFGLAKSNFDISLSQRLEFLSRARGYCNASGSMAAVRQAMTALGNAIQEYLDVASIQDDVLHAVKQDQRFTEPKLQEAIERLDGKLLSVSELFNEFADPLEYHEICLLIFQTTDFRGTEEIISSWRNLINSAEMAEGQKTFEEVSNVVQRLGRRFMNAEFVFPTDYLVPLLEAYSLERAPSAPRGWVVDTFLMAGVSFETLYALLCDLLERKEYPFDEKPGYEKVTLDLGYLLSKWASQSRGRKLPPMVTRSDIAVLKTVIDPREFADILVRVQ
jgi:nuclear pore complex protein Nup155